MQPRLETVETHTVARRDRLERWLGALERVCGRLYADILDAPTLDARMSFGTIGRLRLGEIVASKHRIGLTPALARRDAHDVVKVIVQTVGTSIYEQQGEVVALGPGDGLIYDVSVPHMITSPETTEHLVVIVPRDMVLARGVRLDSLRAQTFSTTTGVGRVGADLLHTTLGQLGEITSACEAELAASLLSLVLLPLPTPQSGSSALRVRIKRYIHDNLRDPHLSIDQIATALRCSKRSLHLAFSACDQTIADFIRAARLDACHAEILQRPERSLSEIAFGWGFASAAHFSRLFRQRFGDSPSALRVRA